MNPARTGLVCFVAVLCSMSTASARGQQRPAASGLLPTKQEAADMRRLRVSMVKRLKAEWDPGILRSIEARMESFTIRQFTAMPEISEAAMGSQLGKIYGPYDPGVDPEADVVNSAHAMVKGVWLPRGSHRLWTVNYMVANGAHGPGTSEEVVECYEATDTGARLVARRDADFSGYGFREQWLVAPNMSSANLLVHASMSGSNGLGSWRAGIYECSSKGLRLVWQSPSLIGLQVTARDSFVTLRYVEPEDYGPTSWVRAWTYELYELQGVDDEPLKMTLVTRVRGPQAIR